MEAVTGRAAARRLCRRVTFSTDFNRGKILDSCVVEIDIHFRHLSLVVEKRDVAVAVQAPSFDDMGTVIELGPIQHCLILLHS